MSLSLRSPRSRAGAEAVELRHPYPWIDEGQQVMVRGATAEDLTVTLDTTVGGSDRDRVDAIMLACLDDPTGSPVGSAEFESLVLGDRNLILAWIARLSFGNAVDLTQRCSNPACGVDVEWPLVLTDLIAVAHPTSTRTIVVGTEQVSVRPATVADERAARRSADPVNALVELLIDPSDVLRSGDDDARKQIEAALDDLDPLASIAFTLACVECQEPIQTTLDVPSLMLDLLRGDDARRPGDHHLLALGYRWGPSDLLALRPTDRSRFADTLADMWDR